MNIWEMVFAEVPKIPIMTFSCKHYNKNVAMY